MEIHVQLLKKSGVNSSLFGEKMARYSRLLVVSEFVVRPSVHVFYLKTDEPFSVSPVCGRHANYVK